MSVILLDMTERAGRRAQAFIRGPTCYTMMALNNHFDQEIAIT